ncbi:Mariner Mos1 transposase [Eumeta japonica]|uniref:Mariner Mos1 transposase n=1 Tax=Eumeta variegata TaxID=151549 RepID=A0A4C1VWC4_EUMVA|nr:Mariner Mos1 transposase [Eumeta japonica]
MVKNGLAYFNKDESCEDDPRPGVLHEAVVQKRRGKLSRGVLFLQHNASVHTARVSRQALKDTGFSEIDHPPYSPDLAPSDYFLFSNLKKELRGRRFVDDNQMKMVVESHFDCKEKEYFLGALKALYTRFSSPLSENGYLFAFTRLPANSTSNISSHLTFLSFSRDKRACERPESEWSPPLKGMYNPRGVIPRRSKPLAYE